MAHPFQNPRSNPAFGFHLTEPCMTVRLSCLRGMAVDPVLSQSVSVGNSLFSAKNTGKIALAEPALARPLRGKPHPTPLLRCLTKSQHSKEQGINWEMLRRSPPHPLKPTSAL